MFHKISNLLQLKEMKAKVHHTEREKELLTRECERLKQEVEVNHEGID